MIFKYANIYQVVKYQYFQRQIPFIQLLKQLSASQVMQLKNSSVGVKYANIEVIDHSLQYIIGFGWLQRFSPLDFHIGSMQSQLSMGMVNFLRKIEFLHLFHNPQMFLPQTIQNLGWQDNKDFEFPHYIYDKLTLP